MKAETLKTFKDKQTGEIRRAGDVFECTPARFNEIAAKLEGYIEKVDTQPRNKSAARQTQRNK